MQTIIGAGGSIALPLAKELKNFTPRIRLVSRHPGKINDTDELMALDVTKPGEVEKAVLGSEVVYITIGFAYNLKVWQNTWPAFMQSVIDACKTQGAKLVFFDNVYMYAKTAIPHMTEQSPLDPPSKKGRVRKQLHDLVMNEVEKGELTALIARAADFYGPDTDKSVLGETVVKNLLKGKKAQAFGDIHKIHTYTFTPDAGKATALLGNAPDAFNQVWHVPTTKEKLTTGHWIQLIADELKVQPRVQRIPNWMLRLLGVFSPLLREFPEMNYQNEMDYVFDSSKFEKRFGFTATAPTEGVKQMVAYYKNSIVQ